MKTWKALFYNLMNIIITNSYLLSLHSSVSKRERSTKHKAFRIALYTGLFEHSKPASADSTQQEKHCQVQINYSACVICKADAGSKRRRTIRLKRQGLQEISPNTSTSLKDKHVNRTRLGCNVCNVNLCSSQRTKRGCWERYHQLQRSGAR